MIKNYDVVVVGAGLGGLVCSCYLAKAGKKVLVVERNKNVGGCCTSFSRNGFEFDACVHSIGSCRKDGVVSGILEDLDLKERIKLTNYDPCDVVISPDHRVEFCRDQKKIINNFSRVCREEESNIRRMMDVIYTSSSSALFINLRRITFQKFLDSYIKNSNLKSIISVPIFGYSGLPASKISAFTAVLLFKEFIMDGGYYPKGGMLHFAESICNRAVELGCDVMTEVEVKEISFKNKRISGVVLDSNTFVNCTKVVANCSIFDLISKMIPQDIRSNNGLFKLLRLEPSLSAFSLHLGMRDAFLVPQQERGNIWLLPSYDLNKVHNYIKRGLIDHQDVFLAIFSASFFRKGRKNTLCLAVNAPYINFGYWKKKTEKISQELIRKAERILPDISTNYEEKIVATPHDVQKFTGNYKGAAYGWRADVQQSWDGEALSLMKRINNLYFVGHWTCQMFGVPGVMNVGRSCSNRILTELAESV